MRTQTLEQLSLFEPDPSPQAPERLGKADISKIHVRQILTKPAGSLGSFDFSLNPYIGCGFGCSYCYASFFQADPDKFETWGTWVQIKANAVEVLRAKRDLRGKRIFMSSATDPYQPLEAKVEITRRLVEEMSDPLRQPRLVVQTRGPLVTRDIDLLKRFGEVRVNMSITTDSDDIRKEFEPSCASIERRLEAVRELKAAGLETGISIMPMLPLHDPEAFGKLIKQIGPDHVYAGFFHRSDRAFAANTRDRAWLLAEKHGWNRAAFLEALTMLERHLPEINGGKRRCAA